jgi:DNA-binding response OmpR family regulator/DNA-binding CsgD family transcriptional regulator
MTKTIVLVVDDSPATLGMLNDTLEAAGFTVLVAQSAANAMQLVERITPDIVLMDAVMPGMDGFEACRRMKQLKALAAVPIIFMTGLAESQDVVRGLEAGGVDYVIKPIAPDEVVARIGVHLANARLTRSAHAALDVAGRFLLACDAAGEVLWATPQAAEMLAGVAQPEGTQPEGTQTEGTQTVGTQMPGKPRLPADVRAWVAQRGDIALQAVLSSAQAITTRIGAPEALVEISCVGRIGPDELLLRLVAVDSSSEELLLKQRLGLTTREAEVLLWLGRGKSNRDIAEILGLSPRTVNKHLEVIYAKLGVENRAAATGIAVRTAGRS